MEAVFTRAIEIWDRAIAIWVAGGWAMIAIAVIALLLFGLGVHVFLRLQETGFQSVPESRWRRWIDHPEERAGYVGAQIAFVTAARDLDEIARAFQELRAREIAPFQRDLRVMKVCIGAAPLVGLFGTVTGMLATFGALATGSGGDQTMALIAAGISEALITTMTGLVVALPGLFFQYQLARKHERYKAFLAHMETVCTQNLYRRLGVERAASAARASSSVPGVAEAGTPAQPDPARARAKQARGATAAALP
ncbi:MAG: MotA/TolQ/ExbB proton channel family protein [Planctomycetes bacterium]|nr:MotA/TolQ/ExbB proton channel family protein [Planctomycetota bacterium]